MAKPKTPSKSATSSRSGSSDPVTRFAEDVVAGKIVVGAPVANACKRHLEDLKHAGGRGFYFDVERAKHAIDFFPLVLKLTGGDYEGKPFTLLRWQQFVVGSLFGWLHIEDKTRRFRVGYVETAKGSGKSPLVAGIGMYGLVADGEARAEIYAAATKKDQAMILFRDAVAMVKMSPMLRERMNLSGANGNEWNIAYREKGSFFRPIAADDNQSGPRVHMGLIDEIHEHKNDNVVEMLRAGTKSRKQALIMMITNSGSDITSVCGNYHEYAKQVAAMIVEDDSFFSYVCALDDGDDPFLNEECWPKTNPSLEESDLPGRKYLREQVVTAKGMPARESIVRRLNFCEWTAAHAPWIGLDIWQAAARKPLPMEQLKGRACVAALDLASTTDLAALIMLFKPRNPTEKWEVVPMFWTPEETLKDRERRDRVPYAAWVKSGFLQTTPGKAISKMIILQRLAQLHASHNFTFLVYDRWRIEDLKQMAKDEGLELPDMLEFGQGFKDMSPAVDEAERMLLMGELAHPGNPVLTWNASCATLESDAAGNRKLSKARSNGRIDGIVAMVMAVGSATKVKDEPKFQMFFV